MPRNASRFDSGFQAPSSRFFTEGIVNSKFFDFFSIESIYRFSITQLEMIPDSVYSHSYTVTLEINDAFSEEAIVVILGNNWRCFRDVDMRLAGFLFSLKRIVYVLYKSVATAWYTGHNPWWMTLTIVYFRVFNNVVGPKATLSIFVFFFI